MPGLFFRVADWLLAVVVGNSVLRCITILFRRFSFLPVAAHSSQGNIGICDM